MNPEPEHFLVETHLPTSINARVEVLIYWRIMTSNPTILLVLHLRFDPMRNDPVKKTSLDHSFWVYQSGGKD